MQTVINYAAFLFYFYNEFLFIHVLDKRALEKIFKIIISAQWSCLKSGIFDFKNEQDVMLVLGAWLPVPRALLGANLLRARRHLAKTSLSVAAAESERSATETQLAEANESIRSETNRLRHCVRSADRTETKPDMAQMSQARAFYVISPLLSNMAQQKPKNYRRQAVPVLLIHGLLNKALHLKLEQNNE